MTGLKSRIITAVILAVLIIASLFTPNIFAFRILFGFFGVMALIEMFISDNYSINQDQANESRLVMIEMMFIMLGTVAVAFFLDAIEIILMLVASVANDIAAYFVGSIFHDRLFKKRPFPNVSPKKSWEGIIGGYIGAVLVEILAVFIFTKCFGKTDDWVYIDKIILFIFISPIAAIFGDWVESFTKRFLGIKDSGEIIIMRNIPILGKLELFMKSHGGFADRIDSWTTVACLMLLIKLSSP